MQKIQTIDSIPPVILNAVKDPRLSNSKRSFKTPFGLQDDTASNFAGTTTAS